MAALLSTLRDSQDIVKELEDPGVDPSLIKQQIEAAEVNAPVGPLAVRGGGTRTLSCMFPHQAIKAETDGLREELEFVRTLGADLIFACGETEKPEVKKTIDEVGTRRGGGGRDETRVCEHALMSACVPQMNAAWEGLNRTWRERMERLEEAMAASVQYQDALQVRPSLPESSVCGPLTNTHPGIEDISLKCYANEGAIRVLYRVCVVNVCFSAFETSRRLFSRVGVCF